jgi:hypothetical protein
MAAPLRRLLSLGVLVAAASLARGDDEVANPYYTFWSKSKVGATAVLKETTKFSGETAAAAGEDTDAKTITYKLAEMNGEKAVVETRVTQQENFGYVETAPTRHIYPAKMSKQALADFLEEIGAKGVAATLKVGDKDLKVTALTGTMKKKGGEEVEFKIWLSDEVPGGIVKRIHTDKLNGEVVAETTTELVSFTKGD